jgi:hypothetical protein
MHAYGSRNAWVDNYVIEDNIAFHKGPFLVGGGRPSRNIRVARNYLYGIDMRIGYNAPHNENCEVRDNVIVNGRLNITRYRKVVQENNLVLPKGAERPKGAKVVLLPSKYDPRRAHLAIFNWQKAKEVEVTVAPFLKTGQEYRILNPQDFYGKPVLVGKCRGKTISVPMEGEFAAFVILRDRRGGAKIGG